MVEMKVIASSSAGNCYTVRNSTTMIMLECGMSISQIRQLGGFKIHEIEACLLSHEH